MTEITKAQVNKLVKLRDKIAALQAEYDAEVANIKRKVGTYAGTHFDIVVKMEEQSGPNMPAIKEALGDDYEDYQRKRRVKVMRFRAKR